jgi:replicative DNA helicase
VLTFVSGVGRSFGWNKRKSGSAEGMAVVVRNRDSRRVPYAKLRERLWESQLPWDDSAECAAIGAVLLAPNGHAKRLSRRAYRGHFYDKAHGWLWEELGLALVKGNLRLDDQDQIREWMQNAKILSRFRSQFYGDGFREITACLNTGFWWHGDYYVDQVIKAAKVRARVIAAASQLGEALESAADWRGP